MPNPGSSIRRRDELFLIVLLLLSGYFSYLQWCKMPSFWGDSARWLFETYRVYQGDTPYRDIASLYPPLSLYAFAIAYKIFGQTFATAQMLLDVLCLALLVSTYALGRLFLNAGLCAAIVLCLAFTGISSEFNFSLFRLNVYTPSILTASLGLNLFLIALIGGLRQQTFRLSHVLLATLGCTLSILSRIELAAPAALCIGLVVAYLWNRQWNASIIKLLGWGLIVIGPTVLVFGYLIRTAGFNRVIEGLVNYGSGSMACPYWPTGLGFLGFLAGLCEGVLLYILGTLLSEAPTGVRRYRLYGAAVASSLITGVYLWAAWRDFPRYWALPSLDQFSRGETITSILALTHLLVAVMSMAIVFTLVMLWRFGWALIRNQTLKGIVTDETVLYASGAALGIRSLFGTLWTELPGVSMTAYALYFVIGGVFLSKAFRLGSGLGASRRATIRRSIPAALFLTYGLARLFWYYHVESSAVYYPLDTQAGRVLLHTKVSVDVYNYVVANTRQGDYVADFGYGGGVNFAARRPGPLFTTMFSFLMPSREVLMKDLERIKGTNPALVIGTDQAHLGAKYGGGTTNGCMFPQLVWRSTRISGDVERPLPAISYIEANYTPVMKTGGMVVLAPRDRRF